MKKNILVTIMLFCAVGLKAQIEGNFCHNKAKQLNCVYWLNYSIKFESNKFKCLYALDSSIYYNAETKIIRISIPNDTLVVQLKEDGVKLFTVHNDNTVFLPIAKGISICDNGDDRDLIRVNKIGNLGILPIIKEKCKLKGLLLPIIRNKSISIFFFRGVENKELYWDIIVNGLKENYQDYNQLKLFANDFNGQVSSINFCFKNGGSADYKNVDPGTEIAFTPNKSKNIIWKIRRVVETKLKNYVAYADLIEYDKKGKVKTFNIPVEQCSCK